MSAESTHEQQRRPLAVVTGASRGIGFALAREFAAHGFDLVIAASGPGIADAAEQLATGATEVEPVRVDLATPAGVDELWRRVTARGRPLDALVLNAGCGAGGAIGDGRLDAQLAVVDLNVRSTQQLAQLALPGMRATGRGRLLLTSSIAASMPGPFQATYSASKAFVQSFGLALRNELRGSGVTVTLLMPGPVDTGFFTRNGMDDTRIARGRKDDPADVARDAYAALMRGRERVVSHSPIARAQQLATRVLPDALKAELVRRMAMPGSGSRR